MSCTDIHGPDARSAGRMVPSGAWSAVTGLASVWVRVVCVEFHEVPDDLELMARYRVGRLGTGTGTDTDIGTDTGTGCVQHVLALSITAALEALDDAGVITRRRPPTRLRGSTTRPPR